MAMDFVFSSILYFIQYLLFFFSFQSEVLSRLERLEIATRRGPVDCACVRETIASHAAIRDFVSKQTGKVYPAPSSLTAAKQGNKRGRGGHFKKKQGSNPNQNQAVQGHARGQSHERPQNVPRANGHSRENSRSWVFHSVKATLSDFNAAKTLSFIAFQLKSSVFCSLHFSLIFVIFVLASFVFHFALV